jgi:hypothetical protein
VRPSHAAATPKSISERILFGRLLSQSRACRGRKRLASHNDWSLSCQLAQRSRRGRAVTWVVVSSGRIAGAWRACSCRPGRLGRDLAAQDVGGEAWEAREGTGLGMEDRISLLSFAFRLFGWAGLESQRRNTTHLLGRHTVVSMFAGVCAELARCQTLQEGGHYGQGFLPGNLRTLAAACLANFSRHLVFGFPRPDPS